MYKYDHIDQTLVDQRVTQFRDQVARRLNGTLAEEEFRPLTFTKWLVSPTTCLHVARCHSLRLV
jgi:sulfite reductase beta subunit-like hemoprotein